MTDADLVDLGDAWDFPMGYAEPTPRYMALVSATPFVDGPRAAVEQIYRLGHSELVQEVSLVAGSRRLDFETHVPWRETASMLRTMMTDAHVGSEPGKASFIDVDAPNVIVEAAKQAEDNDDVIVRLYECAHAQTRTAVRFGFPVQAAAEVNLMEEVPKTMEVVDDTVAIDFRPFEIKTLRLSL